MRSLALRGRLLTASAISIFVALALAGMGISALFAAHVESDTYSGLRDEMNRLVALVRADDDGVTLSQPMPDPRYLKPYGGIYWQIDDPETGPIVWSRSVWDATLETQSPLPPAGTVVETTIVDPEGTPALTVVQKLDFETTSSSRSLLLIVAEDREALDLAITKFRFDLFAGLSVLGLMLVAASWVQVAVGLAPLSAIRAGIGKINAGTERELAGHFPAEVMPLVAEVNALLASQEASISFARARAADLAHGLKTSLTLLDVEAGGLRKDGKGSVADAIQQLTRAMAETIDHQLALARLRHRSRLKHYAVALRPLADRVVAAIQATPTGRERRWTVLVDADIKVDLDPADLVELLGVLLDNAGKWSRSEVRITAKRLEEMVIIRIEDDGPGVSEVHYATLGQRGRRLDERKDGTGIGLAIAAEIVALNSGTIDFVRAELGGLCVRVALAGVSGPSIP